MNKETKTVLLFGSFDIFHLGHKYLISQASKYGDNIIISVAQDSIILNIKKKPPINPIDARIENLKRLIPNGTIVPGDKNQGTWSVIKQYNPNIIVLGYDQIHLYKALKEIQPKYKFILKQISAFKPEQYKSSLLRGK